MVILKAKQLGIEEGKKSRTDCTVVETNIHHPKDSSLLGDCVRVLTRLMKKAKEKFKLKFTNHRLRAKRRVLGISNAESMTKRMPLYRDLILVKEETVKEETVKEETVKEATVKEATVKEATEIAERLGEAACQTAMDGALADAISTIGHSGRKLSPMQLRCRSFTRSNDAAETKSTSGRGPSLRRNSMRPVASRERSGYSRTGGWLANPAWAESSPAKWDHGKLHDSSRMQWHT